MSEQGFVDQPDSSGVVKLKIDKFSKCGPVQIRAVTVPAQGDPSLEVYYEWVKSSEFGFSMPPGTRMPIMIKGWRFPEDVARVVSKETRKPIDPNDKSTWPEHLRLSGAIHKVYLDPLTRKRVSLCTHEEKCPPAVNLEQGIVFDTDHVWILRQDGPPCREEDLAEVRKIEAAGVQVERAKVQPAPSPVGPGVQVAPAVAQAKG